MSKTFVYTNITERVCRGDDYEEYGDEFEYEVDNSQLLDGVVELLVEDYFVGDNVSQKLRCMINDFDLLDVFVEIYEDALKEMFKEQALENYD